jgi:hypothetical protein
MMKLAIAIVDDLAMASSFHSGVERRNGQSRSGGYMARNRAAF